MKNYYRYTKKWKSVKNEYIWPLWIKGTVLAREHHARFRNKRLLFKNNLKNTNTVRYDLKKEFYQRGVALNIMQGFAPKHCKCTPDMYFYSTISLHRSVPHLWNAETDELILVFKSCHRIFVFEYLHWQECEESASFSSIAEEFLIMISQPVVDSFWPLKMASVVWFPPRVCTYLSMDARVNTSTCHRSLVSTYLP